MVQKEHTVVKKQKKIGDYQLMALLLTLISCVNAWSQKPMVALTVDTKKVAPGDNITLTVTSNVEGSVKIDFPNELDVDYAIVNGMEQKMDPSGKIKTYYYMQQSGQFSKEGSYTFSAHITYKNKVYNSNKITIKVDEAVADEAPTIRSGDPVFGYIEAKKLTVYEGEPVLLNAKIISRLQIIDLEGYAPFEADKKVERHEFNNGRQFVEETKLNGKPALMFEYGKQLYIPVSTGKCKVKPFEMALRCETPLFDRVIRFKSSPLTITVKPLPGNAPASFIGGVGAFDITQTISDVSQLKSGDVFTISLTVSGVGNLHNINAPSLVLPKGCMLYGDPEREENVQFTEGGVTGAITFRYNVQVSQTGNFQFEAPAIAYFDPEKEKYVVVKGQPFSLSISTTGKQSTIVVNNDEQKNATQEFTTSSKTSTSSSSSSNTPMVLGITIPTLFLGAVLLVLFIRKKRKQQESTLENTTEKICWSPEPVCEEPAIDFWKETIAQVEDANTVAILLPKAITQLVQNRYGIKEELTRDRMFGLLNEENEDFSAVIREIIEMCDHYRYGFGVQEFPTHDLVETVREMFQLT